MMKKMVLLVCLCVWAQAVAAPTYSFDCISNTSAVNATIGESQLSVEVIDLGEGQVEFLFKNSGPAPSSLTDIYFDDSGLGILSTPMGFSDIVGTVAFSQYAAPADLPGGSGFNTTVGLSADSDSPASHNGVNPSEQLGITLYGDYTNIVNLLDNASLRIGLHVQSIGTNEGSEWFINNGSGASQVPVVPVPVPGALVLAGLGTTLIGALRRRKIA